MCVSNSFDLVNEHMNSVVDYSRVLNYRYKINVVAKLYKKSLWPSG